MKIGKWICGLILMGAAMPLTAQTDNATVRFTHVNRDKDAVERLYLNTYVPASLVAEGWKDLGNCNPGSLPAATLKARLTEINYFRKMAGLHAVTLDPEMNKKAQAAAHLMLKNGTLNHNPPTTWKCYSELAAQGAGSSNLGYGKGLDTYMEDFGDNNQDCGHRMWILKGKAASFGYGGTNSTSAVAVFGPTTEYDSLPQYVAWPPAGFMPTELLKSRWTFALPGEYASYAKATVQLTLNGENIPLIYHKPTDYGDGGLAFEIEHWTEWAEKMVDQRVKVSIKGVKVGEELRSYSYEVAPFNAIPGPTVVRNNDDAQPIVTTTEDAEEEPVVVPFSEMKPTSLVEFTQPSELPMLACDALKIKVVRDLVFNEAFCKFAAQVSVIRKDKKPDPAKLNAWASGKIKAYLARQAGLDETDAAAAQAPKLMLVEITKLISLDAGETYGEIAAELAEKFAENPDLKSFVLKNKRVRQCGVGLAVRRVVKNGQAYAGVYATLVVAPTKLVMGS